MRTISSSLSVTFTLLAWLLAQVVGAATIDMVPPQSISITPFHQPRTGGTGPFDLVPAMLIRAHWINHTNDAFSGNPVDLFVQVQRKVAGQSDASYVTVSGLAGDGSVAGGGDVQAIRDTGLTAGTTYVYRLRSTNKDGISPTHISPWSDPITVTAVSPSSAPYIYVSESEPPTSTSIKLFYRHQVTGIQDLATTRIQLYYSTDGSTAWSAFDAIPGKGIAFRNTTSGLNTYAFQHNGLASHTAYYYRARVSTDNGVTWSSFSDTLRAVTDYAAPKVVESLRQQSVGSTSVRLLFDRNLNATYTSLKYEYKKVADATWTVVTESTRLPVAGVVGINPTLGYDSAFANYAWNADGLTPATSYQFRITGVSSGTPDPNQRSEITVLTQATGVPPTPIQVQASASATGCTLSWTNLALNGKGDAFFMRDGATQTTVKIERRLGVTGSWSQIGTTAAPESHAFQDAPLNAGTLYSYRITALSGSGSSALSDVVMAITHGVGPDRTGPGVSPGGDVTEAPMFSPGGGVFTTTQSVAMSSLTPESTIYYTTDGSVPTTNSLIYLGPIMVVSTTTIRAIAQKPGKQVSNDSQDTYYITTPDALPRMSIAATDSAANENGDTGMVRVSLSAASPVQLTFQLVRSGSAESGLDYSPLPDIVSLEVGETFKDIEISPFVDDVVEGDETVVVTLASGRGYVLGSSTSAQIIIADTTSVGSRPTVSIAASDGAASESGDTGTLRLSLSSSSTSALTVSFRVGGSASNGTDYMAIGASVTFAAGETVKSITIAPLMDALTESNETVVITVLAGSGYTVGASSSAQVVIADDVAPTISALASLSYRISGPIPPGATVTLSDSTNPTPRAATVSGSIWSATVPSSAISCTLIFTASDGSTKTRTFTIAK